MQPGTLLFSRSFSRRVPGPPFCRFWRFQGPPWDPLGTTFEVKTASTCTSDRTLPKRPIFKRSAAVVGGPGMGGDFLRRILVRINPERHLPRLAAGPWPGAAYSKGFAHCRRPLFCELLYQICYFAACRCCWYLHFWHIFM